MKYLSIIFLISSVFAFDFNRAYQDYLFTYNQYRQAHTQYIVAKNRYLTYKTLTAKNTALKATREMLEARSEAVRTYITALRMKISETPDMPEFWPGFLYPHIDDEVAWLISYRDSLPSAATIDDLLDLSQELESKYPKTKVFSYQSLGAVLLGKESSLTKKASELISETEKKVAEVKAGDAEEAFRLERWLLEAKNKLTRSSEKQEFANTTLQGLEPRKEPDKAFHQAQFALKESNQYLKEAVFYLKEIIREIKYD